MPVASANNPVPKRTLDWGNLTPAMAEMLRKKLRAGELSDEEKYRVRWLLQARPNQLTPPGNWNNLLVCAGRGFGKGSPLTTPIATPLGWTTMGDLRIGDIVFDEMGKQCRVLFTSDVYVPKKAYRFQFSDDESIDRIYGRP